MLSEEQLPQSESPEGKNDKELPLETKFVTTLEEINHLHLNPVQKLVKGDGKELADYAYGLWASLDIKNRKFNQGIGHPLNESEQVTYRLASLIASPEMQKKLQNTQEDAAKMIKPEKDLLNIDESRYIYNFLMYRLCHKEERINRNGETQKELWQRFGKNDEKQSDEVKKKLKDLLNALKRDKKEREGLQLRFGKVIKLQPGETQQSLIKLLQGLNVNISLEEVMRASLNNWEKAGHWAGTKYAQLQESRQKPPAPESAETPSELSPLDKKPQEMTDEELNTAFDRLSIRMSRLGQNGTPLAKTDQMRYRVLRREKDRREKSAEPEQQAKVSTEIPVDNPPPIPEAQVKPLALMLPAPEQKLALPKPKELVDIEKTAGGIGQIVLSKEQGQSAIKWAEGELEFYRDDEKASKIPQDLRNQSIACLEKFLSEQTRKAIDTETDFNPSPLMNAMLYQIYNITSEADIGSSEQIQDWQIVISDLINQLEMLAEKQPENIQEKVKTSISIILGDFANKLYPHPYKEKYAV